MRLPARQRHRWLTGTDELRCVQSMVHRFVDAWYLCSNRAPYTSPRLRTADGERSEITVFLLF